MVFIATVCAFISCNTSISNVKIKNADTLMILNGRDQVDTVKYTCDSCESFGITKQTFRKVIDEATSLAKSSLKNQLSFIPMSIRLSLAKQDSLYYYLTNKHIDSCIEFNVDYQCIGKNGYGVENEVKSSYSIFVVGDSVHSNMIEEVRLPPINIDFTSGGLTRQLSLDNADDNGYMTIEPAAVRPFFLILKTSESCVNPGATFTITFADGTKANFRNWNDFNCKGLSYYNVGADDLELFKTKKVAFVAFYDDDNIIARVPPNQSDYFMQYANLISK